MKFTIGTASSNIEFKETMSLIKSSLLYADEIELIGMVEYALFNYIPNHLYHAKEMDQFLTGAQLLLKSLDVPGCSELLSQIDGLNKQLDEIAPILKKKKRRNKQELIAQMKFQQVFKQTQEVFINEFKEAINTSGVNAIQNLLDRNIITVHDYGYEQFQIEELMGGYFGNLINAMKNHTAYPLFDEVSTGVIRSVVDTKIFDIGRTNPEILRHAGVASNILMTLPTLESATVDEILDFKKENEKALKNFRKAIYTFSEKINSLPWDNDFQFECMKLYSVEVAPKVEELNEISSDTNVLINFGKRALADAEVRKAAGFAIGGIAATILSQSGFLEAIAALRDIFIGAALLSVSPQIASGFLKSVDLVNKSRDEVKKYQRKYERKHDVLLLQGFSKDLILFRSNDMNLKDIQNKLNEMFIGSGRKLVFWYDDDASYEENIYDFELAQGTKLWIVNDSNWFETKLMIEEHDPESNYLIYVPFPRPDDRDNYLADIFYYSQHFYSDKLVQIMGDLGIDISYKDEVKRFRKFWTVANTEKFRKYDMGEITKEKLHLGILCVLAGTKTISFDELMKKVLLAGTDDNPVLKKMEALQIDQVFWKLCESNLGYIATSPTITGLLYTMIITYMDTVTSGCIPNEWKCYLSYRQNDAVVFVKNLMNNDETKLFYDSFAEQMSNELCAATMIRKIPLQEILECDAFSDFDENLLSWMASKIEDRMLDEKVAGLTIPQICEERIKLCYHYSKYFEKRYRMIFHAWHVLKGVSLHTFKPALSEVVRDYTDNAYQIDRHYRKFYFYMDSVGLTVETEKLRDLVENIYTNKFLTDFSYKWNQILTDEVYSNYTGKRQEQFYYDFVRPFMKEDGRDGRVIVIISDGLRYECGRELYERLELDEKCSVRMSHMLGVLPSETTLGMASLLPHQELLVDTDLNVSVDGIKCGNSNIDRQKILQNHIARSVCVDIDKVLNAKQSEIRELLQDKDVVYVYQNQIDQRGEGGRSENEVFNACEEAIQEIKKAIHRLTGYVSATRYLVTADHGFIYKRDKLTESDKISIDKTDIPKTNYRYLLSDSAYDKHEALISRSLAYLSKMNHSYVTTPKGTDIIKKQAGGMNYVHGGSSLQEMIVPVVKVITAKGKQDVGYVNVELSSFISRITNTEFKLDFMQMTPVTDKIKPRKLVAFFVDSDGKKISFDVPITANIRETDASKRLITEKFTLRSGKYRTGQDYYLVLADQEDESSIHQKYKFTIDIAEM